MELILPSDDLLIDSEEIICNEKIEDEEFSEVEEDILAIKNMYFKNDVVQSWIEDYLSYPIEIRKVDDYCLKLRAKIMVEVSKIINGIIFKHKFRIWEAYDDLYQEAIEACLKALEKFNPNYITTKGEKATAFNYFSLTAKRCLKFYTIRNKKNRDNSQVDEYENILYHECDPIENSNTFVYENFIKELKNIFTEEQKLKKFLPLVAILQNYLEKIGDYNKRDFFRFAKSYGWSPNLIRKFFKIIKEHKENFNAFSC